MMTFLTVWVMLVVGTAGLALYRKFLSLHEDDFLHLGPGEDGFIAQQRSMATKLAVVDHWGKLCTVAVAVLGIVLASIFLYQQFLLGVQPW
jgi:hypothetical protein